MSKYASFVKIALVIMALTLIVAACAPAPTATPVPAPTKPPAATTAVQPTVVLPTAVPPTAVPPTATRVPPTNTPAKPIDIELWAQATSTQAPAPPDDWIGYKTILEKLNINLKYVIIPTAADGETKINAPPPQMRCRISSRRSARPTRATS